MQPQFGVVATRVKMCQQPSLHLQQVCINPTNLLTCAIYESITQKLTLHDSYKQNVALQGDCKASMKHVQDMTNSHKNSPSMKSQTTKTQTPNKIDRSHSQPPSISDSPIICHKS